MICFKGPWALGPLAVLFVLFIALQLLFMAKANLNKGVDIMSKTFFFESSAIFTGHIASVTGSILGATAMVP